MRDLETHVQDLQEDLEAERSNRMRAEKKRNEYNEELENLKMRLEEAAGTTVAHEEIRKKRESELSGLKKMLDDENKSHEKNMAVFFIA